jgi:hypothetical protein
MADASPNDDFQAGDRLSESPVVSIARNVVEPDAVCQRERDNRRRTSTIDSDRKAVIGWYGEMGIHRRRAQSYWKTNSVIWACRWATSPRLGGSPDRKWPEGPRGVAAIVRCDRGALAGALRQG